MTDEREHEHEHEPVPATEAPAADVPATSPADASGSAPADADGSLLAILDRLTGLLERSDLTEIEVEAGGTGLVLRKATAHAATSASAGAVAVATPGAPVAASAGTSGVDGSGPAAEAPGRPSVKAPLTGIFYTAPGPGSAPYVHVGGEVAVGQVIGLIEAMKLFNEIKSDLAGRVVRVVPESGALVKAKQPLIEVEPL
jgi:acetyl-CoA carboxylase biotin carboxyl carrier protein